MEAWHYVCGEVHEEGEQYCPCCPCGNRLREADMKCPNIHCQVQEEKEREGQPVRSVR